MSGPLRVAIYTRLSQDRDGTKAGTKLQERDCRVRAKALGTELGRRVAVSVYRDQDVSAYHKGRVRPAFEQMCEAIGAGELDIVLAWKLDRLLRRVREGAELLEMCEAHGTRVISLTDSVDTGSRFGKVIYHLFALLGEIESAAMSERLRRNSLRRIEEGRAHGGGSRPFGLNATRDGLDRREARAIRTAAKGIIERGTPIREIARRWNAAGLLTSNGKLWQPQPLRAMLMNPRLTGVRMHGRVPAGDPTGALPVILDQDTHERLVLLLSDPARRKNVGGAKHHYILGGLVVCDNCDTRMVGRPNERHVPRYVCDATPGRGNTKGCYHAIQAIPLEEMVKEAAFQVISGPMTAAAEAAAAADPHEADLRRRIDALLVQEETLLDLMTSPENAGRRFLTQADFLRRTGTYATEREALEAELAGLRARQLKAQTGSKLSLDELWTSRDRQWRHDTLETILGQIRIKGAVRGRNRFDPARVVFGRWKG
ncbi:MAG TPA: recombinase family protein [Miltoncostaeaceae bacterium]|nr:recombinase family protein [Miltoncostaeaceae bacterium]